MANIRSDEIEKDWGTERWTRRRCLCSIIFPEQEEAHQQLRAGFPSHAPFEHSKHKTESRILFVFVEAEGYGDPFQSHFCEHTNS